MLPEFLPAVLPEFLPAVLPVGEPAVETAAGARQAIGAARREFRLRGLGLGEHIAGRLAA